MKRNGLRGSNQIDIITQNRQHFEEYWRLEQGTVTKKIISKTLAEVLENTTCEGIVIISQNGYNYLRRTPKLPNDEYTL